MNMCIIACWQCPNNNIKNLIGTTSSAVCVFSQDRVILCVPIFMSSPDLKLYLSSVLLIHCEVE